MQIPQAKIKFYELILLYLEPQKTPSKELTLTVVETKRLPDFEKTWPQANFSCLNGQYL